MFAAAQQPGEAVRTCCAASSSSRATTRRSRSPRRSRGSEDAFARMMNERARELGLTNSVFRNPTGIQPPGPEGDRARPGPARAAPHRDLSGPLQDLRRAGVHLEQDPPAEPQSAADPGHRRGRAEDGLPRGIRLRPDRLRRAERAAPHPGRERPQDHERPRERSAQAPRMGLPRLRAAPAVRGRRAGRRGRACSAAINGTRAARVARSRCGS